jgi:hypothetical protein
MGHRDYTVLSELPPKNEDGLIPLGGKLPDDGDQPSVRVPPASRPHLEELDNNARKRDAQISWGVYQYKANIGSAAIKLRTERAN